MNSEQLAGWLAARLPENRSLKLDKNRTRVRYVLNWGGFVNQSFSVDDGARRYHLKLTNDLDSVGKLRAWFEIHSLLKQRYRAPEIIGWIEFPEIGFVGLLQEHVNGCTADFCHNPFLIGQLIRLVSCLHQDADIRIRLNTDGSRKTCGDHFIQTYIDRFTADLEEVARGEAPFVSRAMLDWMRDETERLRETADSEPAFHRPADEPVHGDLNEGNVLVTPDGFFIVDWDDLALGDPAVDFAVLLWPMIYQGRPWSEFSIPVPEDAFRKRMQICLRAQLLDEVIDPLADFVAAGTVPSKQAQVQLVKRTRHEEALQKYRQTWCVHS